MEVLARHNVRMEGKPDGRPMVFVHGFGCDQQMWRWVWPEFAEDHRIVLLDLVGAGGSDASAWSPERYGSLQGHADDLLGLCAALDLEDVVLVGHSVSSMIGVLAARAEPERFGALVLVSPSPCYIDEPGYRGGFTRADLEALLDTLDANWMGWAASMAPVIAGTDRPELGAELTESFCRTDPEIARHFARVTFLSDHRADLAGVGTPTLVLQCADDPIAPQEVGRYVHAALDRSAFELLETVGHCPNLTAPGETAAAMRRFLESR